MQKNNSYSEEEYEKSIIELFQDMDYTYVYGPDVEERDFYSPLYDEVLESSLYEINPNLPDEAIKEALFKLRNFDNADLVQKNAIFMDYLQNGITVHYTQNGEHKDTIVYLIDYNNALNNSFIIK